MVLPAWSARQREKDSTASLVSMLGCFHRAAAECGTAAAAVPPLSHVRRRRHADILLDILLAAFAAAAVASPSHVRRRRRRDDDVSLAARAAAVAAAPSPSLVRWRLRAAVWLADAAAAVPSRRVRRRLRDAVSPVALAGTSRATASSCVPSSSSPRSSSASYPPATCHLPPPRPLLPRRLAFSCSQGWDEERRA